jgi:subtilisin-like proprotein convertase family protein
MKKTPLKKHFAIPNLFIRQRIIFSLCLLISFYCHSQTFSGTGGGIQNTGNETNYALSVAGLPSQLSSSFGIEEVSIDVTHSTVEELYIYLRSPAGRIVELTDGASCKGANYTGTSFNSGMANSITLGTAPYTGTFQPVGYLGRFNTGVDGNGTWTLIIKDYLAGGNSGTLNSWSIRFGNTPAAPVTFTSSNLPIVFINTGGQIITEVEKPVDISITDNGASRNNVTDPANNFFGKTNIKIRGSSSKIFEKKSYKLDLIGASGEVINAGLLGMPPESDWVLTASYTDKTFIRNTLTTELFRQMGHYASRSRYVELILNNEYQGIYILCEKPKRSENRIDISKMEPMDNVFPYITGGYIVQIDRTDEPGWFSLYPGVTSNNAKFYYQYNYPKPDIISQAQKNYIKSVLDSFETVMNGPSFADPVTGYKKFIDEQSFLDILIINELSKNPDGYKFSTYLFKDNWYEGGKIHAGPVWDYDLGWHNCNYGIAAMQQWWQYDQPDVTSPMPTWWLKFMQDNEFKNKLFCRWHTLRMGAFSNSAINAYIDKCANELNEAQDRNFKQFPILNAYIYPNTPEQVGTNYWGMVDDMKKWIAGRLTWLDQNVPGYCNNVSLAEISDESVILAYPNPFAESVFIEHSGNQGEVNISLSDICGRCIKTISKNLSENSITEIDAVGLAAGTYFVTVHVDNKTYRKKLIKVLN